MNNARINGTRKISDLISLAMPFNITSGPSLSPQTRKEGSMTLSQVEGEAFAVSAERVPLTAAIATPSRYLDSIQTASRKSNCAGTSDGINVAAA